jgi:hypothetical protein
VSFIPTLGGGSIARPVMRRVSRASSIFFPNVSQSFHSTTRATSFFLWIDGGKAAKSNSNFFFTWPTGL